MNTDLQSQTDLLLKALDTIHRDLGRLELDFGISIVVIVALMIIIAFRRRP